MNEHEIDRRPRGTIDGPAHWETFGGGEGLFYIRLNSKKVMYQKSRKEQKPLCGYSAERGEKEVEL